MADVLDVAEEILRLTGPIDCYRLQKLVYYAQAVHLASYDDPLFSERMEAWRNGPVVPRLRSGHYGEYHVDTVGGVPSHLTADQRRSVMKMFRLYGHQSSAWLINQTHIESPWKDARHGLPPGERSSFPITVESIRDYYRDLLNDPEADAALDQAEEDPGLTSRELAERYL